MRFLLLLMLMAISTMAQAIGVELADVSQFFPNLKQQKDYWSMQVHIGIPFPQRLPKGAPIRYAYFKLINANHYQIILSNSKNCRGEKSCTTAIISAERGAYPQIYYDANYKDITKRIELNYEIDAFITPDFTVYGNEYHPAQIAFRCQDILHTISWYKQPNTDKTDLLGGVATALLDDDPSCAYHPIQGE